MHGRYACLDIGMLVPQYVAKELPGDMASISGKGNVQLVFNLDPCVMKHLWFDNVVSNLV